MFYLGNVQNWLSDIVRQIQQRNLSHTDSTFMIFFFSSFDDDFVKFFKNKKEQISSYSGSNFHIFTPIIYENDIIPDGEWRYIREEFEKMGLNVGNKPFTIIFKLSKSPDGYIPNYLGAYSLHQSLRIDYYLRDVIDLFVMEKQYNKDYSFEMEKIFGSPNQFKRIHYDQYSVLGRIDESIKIPSAFLSHSSKDKDFVRKLRNELIHNNVKVWFDESDIFAGDSIRKEIQKGINKSDLCLFIISQNSINSDWTKYEVYKFLDSFDSKRIIPIILDDSIKKLPDTLKQLTDLKYIDFSDSSKWSENIIELIKAMRRY
jgi:hypothetical protein